MGRGRAKAKQTKVARELKYGGPDMDLNRLRTDLGAPGTGTVQDEMEAAWGSRSPDDDEEDVDDDV